MTIEFVVHNSHWSLREIDAPAGQGWHASIDNQDTDEHNFTVASGPRPEQRIFASESFKFGTFDIDIPPLPPDRYIFICTIHPQSMTGDLVLE